MELMKAKPMNLVLSAYLGDNAEWDMVAGQVAELVAANIKTVAMSHRRTGNYIRSIKVEKGKVDFHVKVTDPAASHIEFGHRLSGDSDAPDGLVSGYDTSGSLVEIRRGERWIRALHIVRTAALIMEGIGYKVRIGKKQ